MEALSEFQLLRPTTLSGLLDARSAHPGSQLLGGGTDLIVNLRHGIVAPPVLIDVNGVAELRTLEARKQDWRLVHRSGLTNSLTMRVSSATIALSRRLQAQSPAPRIAIWAQSGVISASTRAASSTTRANGGGRPTIIVSRRRATCAMWRPRAAASALPPSAAIWPLPSWCLAQRSTWSGPSGRRTLPLEELYIGRARHDGPTEGGDGKNYLALQPGELVAAVRARCATRIASAYDKIRIRRSIEYPVAGVAVALRREGDSARRPAGRHYGH